MSLQVAMEPSPYNDCETGSHLDGTALKQVQLKKQNTVCTCTYLFALCGASPLRPSMGTPSPCTPGAAPPRAPSSHVSSRSQGLRPRHPYPSPPGPSRFARCSPASTPGGRPQLATLVRSPSRLPPCAPLGMSSLRSASRLRLKVPSRTWPTRFARCPVLRTWGPGRMNQSSIPCRGGCDRSRPLDDYHSPERGSQCGCMTYITDTYCTSEMH